MALSKFKYKIKEGNYVLGQVLVTDGWRQKRLYCCLNHVEGCETELHLVDHKIQLGFVAILKATLWLGMYQWFTEGFSLDYIQSGLECSAYCCAYSYSASYLFPH